MIDLKTVKIGSSMRRGPGLFSQERFLSAERGTPRRAVLGETEQAWYTRAKAAAVKYDSLVDRAGALSDKAASSALLAQFYGTSKTPTQGRNVRNSLATVLLQAEAQNPHDYSMFGRQDIQSNVETLENLDRTFDDAVTAAEKNQKAAPKTVSGHGRMQGPSLGLSTESVVCGAAGLVLVATIFYFAFAK